MPVVSFVSAVFQLTARIVTYSETNAVRDRLIKAVTGTFGLRIVSTGLSFVISVLMARILGAAGYGTYSYVMAWIALLGVPALFGLDRLLVRELAVYRTQAAWHLAKGLLHWANRVALLASVGLGLLAGSIVWISSGQLGVEMSTALTVGVLMLPLVTFVSLRAAALHGMNHVVIGLLPEFFIRPLLLVVLLGVAYVTLGNALSPQWALALHATALVITLLIATHLLHKMVPEPVRESFPASQAAAWLHSTLPMMLISGMNVINHRTDTLMLGSMQGTEAVGIYTVAERGAHLIAIVQQAVSVALAPTIAGLFGAGKMGRLQHVVTKSAQLVLFVSGAIAGVLILFGNRFLLLFGAEFVEAYTALAILTAGYVVNTGMGIASLVLVMTKYERDSAMCIGVGVLVNVALNAALIPKWGVEGAATATAISMMIRNVLAAVFLHRRLGIHSTVLGGFSLKSKRRGNK